MAGYLLALDEGTSSCRAIIFDAELKAVAVAQEEFPQIYPQPGWVEHDPLQIWRSQLRAARGALAKARIRPGEIAGLGITNQRETIVVWEKATGQPVHNAIVWQCRRTAPLCEELKQEGWGSRIGEKTGLVIDAYFSATKLAWILDRIPGARARAQRGELLFGTIDTWLLWNLSGGTLHLTDHSNASRTMMFNIKTLTWDEEILARLGIPAAMLPAVRPSAEVYGYTLPELFGAAIPLASAAGDQQAALFGQACLQPGQAKNTYGTGCFLLMNTGAHPVQSHHGLLTTIAWGLPRAGGGAEVTYALEGSVFIAGAAIQWLRDGLGLLASSAESEALAESVPDTGGVYLVPAFAGLGAPYWDMSARGAILGLTRGTGRAHLVRAALEAMAYQTRDVLEAMAADAGTAMEVLRADGGASTNRFLLQFQADLLNVPVETAAFAETTALGAAGLAGLATGTLTRMVIEQSRQNGATYRPLLEDTTREALYRGWQRAVAAARHYARESGR